MTPRFSLYLDFFRFMAAMIVFVSHFAYPRFTDGHFNIIRDQNVGSDAVVFFFVLSGLLIAYTADTKDKTLRQYAFNRVTRLYSVIIPALVLTIIFDASGQYLAPENYEGWWFNPAPIWQQFFHGVFFTGQWAGQNFRIGTNGPYWSLSYEAAYYILFGVTFYLGGLKRALLLLPLIILFGFSVMFLFPTWLLGIWVYKEIRDNRLSSVYVWPCTILPPLIYALMLGAKIPKLLLLGTYQVFGSYFVNDVLAFSNEFIWNFIIALLVAMHLIGVAALCRRNQMPVTGILSFFIRWCAGATFTIYVIHYPALQFMDSLLPESWMPSLRYLTLSLSVLIFCFFIAELSERRLKWLRRQMLSI